MLVEELAALASAGGTALVTAMVTDGWEGVRARFARLLGRGDVRKAETAVAQLEQSRNELTAASGAALDQIRTRQQIAWQTRLEDFLQDDDPGAYEELRILVDEIQAQTARSVSQVRQHAVAFDQAQQAVLGQGVQNVTFGGQDGPGSQK